MATRAKLPPQSQKSKTEMLAFRISRRDLEQIDARAQERNMTRTQYITDAALDRLEEHVSTAEERDQEIEDRLVRLEQLAFGS